MTARFIVGDTREVLATLPEASIDLVVTSSPFLALRSYLPADHPDKASEIGSESTPGEFLDVLLDVVEECARVLAPHGSLVFELGDTYSGSGGAGGDYAPADPSNGTWAMRSGQPKFAGSAAKARGLGDAGGRTSRPDDVAAGITHPRSRPGPEGRDFVDGWPLDKSLCMIPSSFAWALAYGRNPWTGRPTDRWRVRNLVAWCRPNPPVGALGDKFRPGTSYLTVACKSRTRWFDLDAVRTEPKNGLDPSQPVGNGLYKGHVREDGQGGKPDRVANAAGAPPLDWWEIPTQPYAGSHYATFPEKLVMRPIEAMCPREVCRECGEPRRRVTDAFTLDSYRASDRVQTQRAVALADEHGLTDEHIAAIRAFGTSDAGKAPMLNSGAGRNTDRVKVLAAEAKDALGRYFREFVMSTNAERSSAWIDCGHDDYRRGIVLDPFAGSGTTLAVAEGLGRDSIGIDLDARNTDLAQERCGMFLSVESQAEATRG